MFRFLALPSFLLSTLALVPTVATDPTLLSFSFDVNASNWRQWFKQSEMCNGTLTMPDQAMAAFRRDDGSVVALIDTYALRGPSITELEHNCSSAPVLLDGGPARHDDPSVFPHRVWLTATWTADGETVYGLVHDEYHAKSCPHATCWMTTVLAVKSTDGGRNFSYMRTESNPRAIALASPLPYEASFTHPQGLPNNHIVQDPRDGWIYSLVACGQGSTAGSTTEGTCVYRTKDVSNVSSWRGWDGKGWAATVVDPYSNPPPSTAGHLISPVGAGRAASGSVTYLESAKLFVAMDSRRRDFAGVGHMQVSYMTSTNMTTWSPLRFAGYVPLPEEYIGETAYPHLMDAKSPSRNFDVIGANSTEVWFQFITGVPGHVPCYRAGVAVPVTITHDFLAREILV